MRADRQAEEAGRMLCSCCKHVVRMLSVRPFVLPYVCICMSIYLTSYIPICLSVCLYVCLSVCMSVYMRVSPSIRPSIYSPILMSAHPPAHQSVSPIHPSTRLSDYSSTRSTNSYNSLKCAFYVWIERVFYSTNSSNTNPKCRLGLSRSPLKCTHDLSTKHEVYY